MKRPAFTRWSWWTKHDMNMLDVAAIVLLLTATRNMTFVPSMAVAAVTGLTWGLVCRYLLKIERPR